MFLRIFTLYLLIPCFDFIKIMWKLLLRYRKILPCLIIIIIICVIFVVLHIQNPVTQRIYKTHENHLTDKVLKNINKISSEKYKIKLPPYHANKLRHKEVLKFVNDNNTKYILEWIPLKLKTTNHNKLGQNPFIENQCTFTNCFITNDKKYFRDVFLFDAILFNRKHEDIFLNRTKLPGKRSVQQKYMFVSTLPAQRNLVLNPVFDSFFNWTWTYRFDSDFVTKPFTIHEIKTGTEIGPSLLMTWPNLQLEVINDTLKMVMVTKHKAAVWFAGSCIKNRVAYVLNINKELSNYGWSVDIFGKCGYRKCKSHKQCTSLIKRDYYFFFAFEEAVDDDYITDTVLVALHNFAIPVVYGGADYSRFLPDSSYLNARALGPKKLANTMNRLIRNMTEYYSYLEWINYYRFEKTVKSKEICNICKALNAVEMNHETSYYKDFRIWWNRKRWTELYDRLDNYTRKSRFSQQLLKRLIDYIV